MAKKLPYYSQTPYAPSKKKAETNPLGGPRMGTFPPTTAPRKPGRTPALVQPQKLKIGKPHRVGHR